MFGWMLVTLNSSLAKIPVVAMRWHCSEVIGSWKPIMLGVQPNCELLKNWHLQTRLLITTLHVCAMAFVFEVFWTTWMVSDVVFL